MILLHVAFVRKILVEFLDVVEGSVKVDYLRHVWDIFATNANVNNPSHIVEALANHVDWRDQRISFLVSLALCINVSIV